MTKWAESTEETNLLIVAQGAEGPDICNVVTVAKVAIVTIFVSGPKVATISKRA